MCSLIPLFKATWSKGVWKQAGTSNCPPGFVCCFLSQQVARLKLALRRAKMRCNLVVIWPFNLPWDERERGRVCQSMGTVPMWSRSLLPRGWSYDQRDSGALDFLEQALRDAPGLLQQLWHPLRLPCRLIKLTADTRSRGGLFFCFFILASAFCCREQSHGDFSAKATWNEAQWWRPIPTLPEEIPLCNLCWCNSLEYISSPMCKMAWM